MKKICGSSDKSMKNVGIEGGEVQYKEGNKANQDSTENV